MRDGRPNPDIWGNIITCGEIAVGIYEIVGTKKRGLEVPKAVAEEILPESVLEQAAQDGENLCFTDPVSNAIVADALLEQELVTDPQAAARLDAIRQLDDVEGREGGKALLVLGHALGEIFCIQLAHTDQVDVLHCSFLFYIETI